MFQPVMATISRRLSGVAAKEHVAEISRFHRIQASPGFRQAAAFVHGRLAAAGLDAETLSYTGDGKSFHWSYLSPCEWEAEEAELWQVESGDRRHKFADFRECKIALIQRSDATHADGIEAGLAVLDDGTEHEHYVAMDVRGMVVLTASQDLRRVRELAVDHYGAVGILYDGLTESPPVRTRIDLPDARQYVSFWQAGDEKSPCWGFSLSPRLGDRLREQAKKGGAEAPVRLWAKVRSHFKPNGHIEVVSALIPGETEEEVLVVSHLCHPQPSANDNASGAGAAMEMALALHALVDERKLPKPCRGIRFLWVPEMTGTFAYLANHQDRIAKTIAAINLDMVGQNQDLCGSSFLIERPPRAMPSFVDDLIVRIREELTHESRSHTGAGEYALFRHAVTPFSGGSDHYVLSDPTVGIPCPMLIQWPDRFYHTSADTPDRTDPNSLRRTGALAAAYAYWLAAAGDADAAWLGQEMTARFKTRLVQTAQQAVTAAAALDDAQALAQAMADLDRRIAFLLDRHKAALGTLERLAQAGCLIDELAAEAERAAQHELAWANKAIDLRAAGLGLVALPDLPSRDPGDLSDQERQAAKRVPVRLVRGPVPLGNHLQRLDAEDREQWRRLRKSREGGMHYTLTELALYWADGKRSVLEIADLVELEAGVRDVELLLAYFELLAKLGFVTL